MTLARIGAGLLMALAFCGANAQGKAEKKYPLPGRGTLVVTVPANWIDELKQDDQTRAPTISYTLAAGKPPQVMMTPIWPARSDTPPITKELVRQYVENALKPIREQAVEKSIPIVEFAGKSGAGYYFDATDKDPAPGEFKYLRQGMLMTNGIALGFTILTHSRQEPLVREAMQVLQGAAVAPKQ
ncbi:MAG TPA: hypothetical protein VHN19_12145 [Burkholderiales bacterium]|jgi:hypothetical protein|nr:hypothetical protein [Burkholderiales bacterium]